MLNPLHLRTLATVVHTGSFADAARELGYTASAVSQQVSMLERQLKVQLFERLASSVRPTFVAEFLAQRSDVALSAINALEDEVVSILRGEAGRLRLGSFPSASERLLPQALSLFRQRFPDVHIRLDEGEPDEILPLLSIGELDACVVYRYSNVPAPWGTLATARVLSEDLLVLVPTTQAPPDSVLPLSALRDETWIATREGTAAVMMLRHLCHSAGFEPRISYRSNNYSVIQGLVQAGLGVALVPALARHELTGVSTARLDRHEVSREVHIAVAANLAPALVTNMEEAVRTAAAQVASSLLGVHVGARPAGQSGREEAEMSDLASPTSAHISSVPS